MPRATTVSAIKANTTILTAATGRWGELASEITAVEPYVITDDLVITPLTRRRRKKLRAAQTAYMLAAARLADVVKAIEDDKESGVSDDQMVMRIQKLVDDAEAAYDEALFGDAKPAVYEYFEDQNDEYWDAMYTDVHSKLVHRIAPPEDSCSKCGRAFEDADVEEGKAASESSSSTSSTDSGTPSKVTSVQSSA